MKNVAIRGATAVLVALLTACREPTPTQDPGGTVETTACPDWAGAARCGVFHVAENRDGSSGRRVTLAFVVLSALTPTPPPDAVFYVAGGPGQTLTEIGRNLDLLRLREARDVVLLDQRGTSVSPRLDCPSQAASDPQAALTPSFDVAEMTACRNALQAGADLRRYTTIETVRDLEAFRHALGYERVNLVGASYGTRVILEYLRQYPSSVRSAVMTSAAPHAFRNPLYHARSAQDAFDAIVLRCSTEPACVSEYPNPRADLELVLSRLAEQPATTTINDPQTGLPASVTISRDMFAEALRVMMYSAGHGRSVPRFLREAATGHYEAFATQAVASMRALRTQLRYGLLMSVVCSEDVSRIADAEIPIETNATFIGDTRVRQQMAACAVWPKASIPIDYGNAVVSSVPSLLISGRYDPVTPPKWGEMAAAGLSRSRHIVTDGAHSPNTLCTSGIIAAFVASGDPAALDVSCASVPSAPSRRQRR